MGSYKKRLKDFPEKERSLWRIFDATPFEEGIAANQLASDDVLKLLDYPALFELTGRPLPPDRDGILEGLRSEALIATDEDGSWLITNLGAVLFAKRLDDFRTLRRKAVRVVQYRHNSRVETLKEQVGTKG